MLIGQTIFLAGTTSTYVYYSPWFPSRADNGYFTYERIYSTLTNAEKVTLQHKNAEDAGIDGSLAVELSDQLGTTDFFQGFNSDVTLEELVRYRVELDGEKGSPTAGELLCIRFLAPTWFSTARA